MNKAETSDTPPASLTPKINRKRSASFFINYGLAILTFLILGYLIARAQTRVLDFSAIFDRPDILRNAFITTIRASFTALIFSVIFGLILYFFSISKIRYLRALSDVFTEIIYGTPLLVMIFMMGFIFRASINNIIDMIGITDFIKQFDSSFRGFSGPQMGLAGLTIYITPYMANIFRAAFSSIPEEQYMAMHLFGFTTFQRYRYIIVPQVIRVLMAPLMNNFSLIIKGSALLNIVMMREIYYELFSIQQRTGRSVEAFFVMWLLYLAITLPLSQFTRFIERRWGT